MNAESVISQFNGQSTQAVALTGARKLAIQAVLRPDCRDALAALVELVGTIGPSQVFLGIAQLVQQTHHAGL